MWYSLHSALDAQPRRRWLGPWSVSRPGQHEQEQSEGHGEFGPQKHHLVCEHTEWRRSGQSVAHCRQGEEHTAQKAG